MSEASLSVFMELIKQPLVPAKESKSMKRWAKTKKKGGGGQRRRLAV